MLDFINSYGQDPAYNSLDITCEDKDCRCVLGGRSDSTPLHEVFYADIEGGSRCADCDDIFCDKHLLEFDGSRMCPECYTESVKINAVYEEFEAEAARKKMSMFITNPNKNASNFNFSDKFESALK